MSDLASQVEKVFKDCLYKEEELTAGAPSPVDAVLVDGIVSKFGFHPVRIVSHVDEVRGFCNLLPATFQKSGGGGWSFLQMCQTADGTQWGEHRNCEQLLCLAIGLGLGGYCLPREVWSALPGGMPYLWLDTAEGRSLASECVP